MATPILSTMKLDLIAVRKLSPAGLWDLKELKTLISTLLAVIACGLCDAGTVSLSGRMLKQYRRDLHERTLDNFNMRVKAWVLQCPSRIAYVRSVIGEAAIKKWHKNRLLDYAFTQAFGDWVAAFPNGVQHKDKPRMKKTSRGFTREFRTYVWKPFALVKIPNAARILFGQRTLYREAEECRAAYFKLWNVDIADAAWGEKSTQPREPRTINPVRFRPDELREEAATGVPENASDDTQTARLANGEPEIFPPPKSDFEPDKSPEIPDDFKPP